MKLKIKPCSPNFKIPAYATKGSACFDLFAAEDFTILPGGSSTIKLGFKVEIEEGYFLELRPRSGLAATKGITLMNSPGTIDEDYRGEVKAIVYNSSKINYRINMGDKICQGMVRKCEPIEMELVEELAPSERGEGGLGSTGT